MPQFSTKQGDRKVALAVTLTRGDGTVVDLTGLSISAINVNIRIENDSTAAVLTEAITSIDDASAGEISWQPSAAASAQAAGRYLVEFEVTHVDSLEETFPVQGRLLWDIIPAIA